ncbi:MAG: D-2-hydroxyacid dehydrogenase [Anaerolineae bacterium]|nr:D-2-hydroxyacid dehydrogenase [Anaerolineae bacterium]MDW8068477.1 D-2-hydroxyacid dehydrogenase [Anaerolineae bacterium]
MPVKLLLPDHLVERLREPVGQIVPDSHIIPVGPDGEVTEDLEGAEILFLSWRMSPEAIRRLIAYAPHLRWVHAVSAGVDHLLFPELQDSDIILTNARGVFSVPIAEMVMAYILAVAKRLPEFWDSQREHRWEKLSLRELHGLTVGIIGLGDIGTEVARRCRVFGMHVLGLRRHPGPGDLADEVLPPARLPDLLARADFVVIAVPLTPETRGLIGRAELAAMKPDAWLINISRGAVVDEEALIEALQARCIGGACLDVFVEEPLPPQSPLWEMPNVLITPHNSWSSPHIEARQMTLFLENLRRYVAGEPLQNVVDKQAGY